jgi:hypothetical protein
MATGAPLTQDWVCPQRQCRRPVEDKNILPLPVIESRNLTFEDEVRGSNVSPGTQDHESATLFITVPWELRGWDSDGPPLDQAVSTADLSLRKPGFNRRPVHVGFLETKWQWDRTSPLSKTPPMPHKVTNSQSR